VEHREDHGDVGANEPGKAAHLARRAHANLEHGKAVPRTDPEYAKVSGSPEFSLLAVRNVGRHDARIVARISLVVVLPCEPVTAMKVVRRRARRQSSAAQ
jgi:hypothetical protein